MNEKTKKEGYTDQLNQELLGTLGEKASSEQISAAYEKREVHSGYELFVILYNAILIFLSVMC